MVIKYNFRNYNSYFWNTFFFRRTRIPPKGRYFCRLFFSKQVAPSTTFQLECPVSYPELSRDCTFCLALVPHHYHFYCHPVCLRVSCIDGSNDISMTHTRAPYTRMCKPHLCRFNSSVIHKNISKNYCLAGLYSLFLTQNSQSVAILVGWLFVCASFHSFVNMIRFLLQLLKDLLHLPPMPSHPPPPDAGKCCRLHLAGNLIHLMHYLNCSSSKRPTKLTTHLICSCKLIGFCRFSKLSRE